MPAVERKENNPRLANLRSTLINLATFGQLEFQQILDGWDLCLEITLAGEHSLDTPGGVTAVRDLIAGESRDNRRAEDGHGWFRQMVLEGKRFHSLLIEEVSKARQRRARIFFEVMDSVGWKEGDAKDLLPKVYELSLEERRRRSVYLITQAQKEWPYLQIRDSWHLQETIMAAGSSIGNQHLLGRLGFAPAPELPEELGSPRFAAWPHLRVNAHPRYAGPMRPVALEIGWQDPKTKKQVLVGITPVEERGILLISDDTDGYYPFDNIWGGLQANIRFAIEDFLPTASLQAA